MPPPVIDIENLTCRYGGFSAVRDLTLQVPEGSVYAFLGTNGAGKTTVIRTLLNLLPPASGAARVFGVPVGELGPAELTQIGYVSGDQKLPAALNVRQLIDYSRALYPTWDDAFCTRLLELLALPLDRSVGQFSTGMKIKAALLIALAYRPRLLILDEPFSGLDPLVRDELVQGMRQVFGMEKWTMFVSSHDIAEIETLANFVGILHRGRLCVSEPLETLRARYRRVDLIAPSADALLPPPALGVMQYEAAGAAVHWIEPRFTDDQTTAAQIQAAYPAGTVFTTTPLPLREIFVAITRHLRDQPDANL